MPLCEKLGRLLINLMKEAASEIEFEILGAISEHDTSLLTVAFLKGFLDNISMDTVTYVNAPVLAQERGIVIKESKSRRSRDFINLIQVTASNESGKMTAGATLVGKGQEMFVHVLDFDIEIAPSRFMAFISYDDKPGMIGKVGTALGDHDINIAGLQVGRKTIKGEAGMGLNLDVPLDDEVIGELTAQQGVRQALLIELQE
jgi:D-3-phosphoglycerate dehydrogenase